MIIIEQDRNSGVAALFLPGSNVWWLSTLTPSQELGFFLSTFKTISYWADPGMFAHETLVGEKGWFVLDSLNAKPQAPNPDQETPLAEGSVNLLLSY
jgi:hypothetical protein